MYKYCTIEVSRGINFDLHIRSKTPTHDLSPYFFLHFLSTTAGSWISIEINLRDDEFYKKNISVLEHSYLHETLLHDAQENMQSQTLKTNRDCFVLFLVPHEHTSSPLSLKVNLTSTFYTETSNKFEFKFSKLKCKSILWKWVKHCKWMTLEQKTEIDFAITRNIFYRMMSVGGSPSSINVSMKTKKQNSKLILYWMDGNFLDFHSFLLTEPKVCHCNPHLFYKYDFCLSFNSSKQKYYIFIRGLYVEQFLVKSQFLKEVHLNRKRKSWRYSLKRCEDEGGKLPMFGSRQELNEFLALIKLSPYLPPVVAVYLGMKKSTEVSLTEVLTNTSKKTHLERTHRNPDVSWK